MNTTRKTSSKKPAESKKVKMTQAQLDGLHALATGPSADLNKKTATALVARGWAKETRKGVSITALGKKSAAVALVA